jgi:acetoin utilization protein AcuB
VIPPEGTTLVTITPGDTVEKAAAIMLKHHISALPVLDARGSLAGILTKGDVFKAFVSISGVYQGPLAMGLELPDQPGYIKQVTDVIREHGGRIASIMTRYEDAPEGFKRVYIRAKDVQNEPTLHKNLGTKHRVLYFIRENVAKD